VLAHRAGQIDEEGACLAADDTTLIGVEEDVEGDRPDACLVGEEQAAGDRLVGED